MNPWGTPMLAPQRPAGLVHASTPLWLAAMLALPLTKACHAGAVRRYPDPRRARIRGQSEQFDLAASHAGIIARIRAAVEAHESALVRRPSQLEARIE
jgi:hypothetical protein